MAYSQAVSVIDGFTSGGKRTDVVEIVDRTRKKYIGNIGKDISNYSFTTKVEFFTARASYTTNKLGHQHVNLSKFVKIDTEPAVTRTDLMVVTNAVAGEVEFRIPQDLVPTTITVPVDSSNPLIAMVSIEINTDTTDALSTILQETVLVIVRYTTR